MHSINPYINFNGNCEEAFNFYKKVFGREFLSISRFKDAPAGASPVSKDQGDLILHVALPLGKSNILMGSDCPGEWGKVSAGTNMHISLHPETEKEAETIFHALSVGGKVSVPLQKMFWNAYFGMVTDPFGVQWMVNYDYGK
ncbi:MAG: VOC family protein [Candidatus Omnitrophica bacterium]|nr:VOC family protein [Candidatus Omnitrophota bacterium]